jgi:hypothetical protein
MGASGKADRVGLAIAIGFGLLLVGCLLLVSAVSGRFALAALDADNAMRLVEIQDYLNGQNWFDVSQARLGPEGGTAMHWSRLVDVPVLLIRAILDVFLLPEAALYWAVMIWPPMSVLLLVIALAAGARFLGGRAVLVFTCIIAASVLFRQQNFLSGSIDHHNLQMGFLAMSLAFSIDPKRRPVSLALAGGALASSLALGVEVYPFVAVICAFQALDWAVAGRAAQKGAAAFGASLGLMSAVFFLVSIAPSQYGAVYCDALSLITVCAAMLGGLGLAGAAFSLSGRSLVWRLAGLGMLALACGLLLKLQAPQCLVNPVDALPEFVRTMWLENVSEARPLFALRPNMLQENPFMVGMTMVAALVSVWQIEMGVHRRAHVLFVALIAVDLLMTLQQIRFYTFGHVFAILPLAVWVAGLYSAKPDGGQRGAIYVLALAVSLPLVWGAPGLILKAKPAGGAAAPNVEGACTGQELLAALAAQPEGLVLAVADAAPDILRYTGQSALYGNYHRNVAGIDLALRIFIARPEEAAAMMHAGGIDYVLACPSHAEMALFGKTYPEGFAARLAAGDSMAFLTPVAASDAGDALYAVER